MQPRFWMMAFLILMPVSLSVGPASLNAQWADLAALGFLISAAAAGVWRLRRVPLLFWCLLYVGSLLPSLWQTPDLAASCVALAKTGYLVVLGLVIAQWAASSSARDALVNVFALVVSVTVVLALGIWIYARWSGHVPASLAVAMAVPNVGPVVRVKATLLTPTLLANYLTVGVPILVGYAATTSRWPRAMSWGILGAGLLAAATTVSHSLAGCLTAGAMIAPRTTRWDRLGGGLLSVLAVGAILMAWVSTTVSVHGIETSHATAPAPPAFSDPHEVLGPRGTGEELTVRVRYVPVSYGRLKRLAWEAWQRHPWIGVGVGQFSQVVAQAFQAGRIPYASADPHSTWLGSLAETGLIGLAGLVGLWIAILREARRARHQMTRPNQARHLGALLAGLIGLLVNSVHVDIMHFRFSWVAVALLLAMTASMKSPARPHA